MKNSVIETIYTANQRGGRMLSVIDLVERDTLTPEQAAFLTHRVAAGDSFLVGARPGGAGKTTLMCALLAMIPEDEPIALTTQDQSWQNLAPRHCLVAYEISPGSYLAYIWDKDLRTFLDEGLRGNRLVTNLHADDLQEAYEQLVSDNGATSQQFDTFNLFLPIYTSGSFLSSRHKVPFIDRNQAGDWEKIKRGSPPQEYDSAIVDFIHGCLNNRTFNVEHVREAWLNSGIPQRLSAHTA